MSSQKEHLARVVADTVGIEDIRFDADNSISLEFDGTLVTLAVIESRLVLQADLTHLSGFSDEASLFRFLLTEDESAEVAGGNYCLAIDRAANTVELCCTLTPLDTLDKNVLTNALDRFYGLIRHWSLKLNRFSLPQQGIDAGAQVPGTLV